MAAIWADSIVLVTETCWKCGVQFAMPRNFYDNVKSRGLTFYCCNGHPLSYGESEESKLLKQIAEKDKTIAWERQRKDQLAAELRDTRETSKREKAALKGNLTKMKNRVGRGVCPCCNRFFADLHRHMSAKHPEFSNEEAMKD